MAFNNDRILPDRCDAWERTESNGETPTEQPEDCECETRAVKVWQPAPPSKAERQAADSYWVDSWAWSASRWRRPSSGSAEWRKAA